jgi:hypothetical protein
MSTEPNHSHATIALDILDASTVESLDPGNLDLSEALAYAQVHATLAVAEEQRTANLLALTTLAIRSAELGIMSEMGDLNVLLQEILGRLGQDEEATR